MKAAFLSDRGVIKLSGEDARSFLNGLVTSEIAQVAPGAARYAALLTPQGKVIADFLVTEIPPGHGGGLLLDCPKQLAKPLADRLGFYKLRAKVAVENLSDDFGVLAIWDGEPSLTPDLMFRDPRHAQLGWRMLVPPDLIEKAVAALGAQLEDISVYETHRIACGVPRGGEDFKYSDAFPHDINMDKLHGVDFDKGCYVGQEVVSRMQHRGTARTRIVAVRVEGDAPAPGTSITAGDKFVGTLGASSGQSALALVRIDRVADALDANLPLIAEGRSVALVNPDDVRSFVGKASA